MRQTSRLLARHGVMIVALAALWSLATHEVSAQERAFGLGPRLTFVRGDAATTSSTRYSGGLLRLRASEKTAIEVSLDYRSHLNDSLTERIKNYPIQGSVLMYPVRTSLAPYLLGGLGWYSQRVDKLKDTTVTASSTTRRVGYHAGVGGELRMGSRAALHVDYRYTFIRFGQPEGTPTSPGALPLPGTITLQEKLKLSHEGSMWTAGVTMYF